MSSNASALIPYCLCGMCHVWGIDVLEITNGTVFNLEVFFYRINDEVLIYNWSVLSLPWMCSLKFLLTYLMTKIQWVGRIALAIDRKHFSFTSQPYNDVHGLTETKKSFCSWFANWKKLLVCKLNISTLMCKWKVKHL